VGAFLMWMKLLAACIERAFARHRGFPSRMKIFRTSRGVIVETDAAFFCLDEDWDALLNNDDLSKAIHEKIGAAEKNEAPREMLAPVVSQEIWAAGVTYLRSKAARMEESKDAGGGSFYDRVYDAERPELFFKSSPWRVVGDGGKVRIRRDSKWNVPEPELTLFINARGKIAGYTIGNDMSSRDIEGENPLYLPQAKTYDGSCALGPCVLVAEEPLKPSTKIGIEIMREKNTVFSGETSLSQIKRPLESLAEFLFRETSFPHGVFLMTGTGIVPPDTFTLLHGDEIRIAIEGIGMLSNAVA
jgi:2-dehydro-3-deoxy-D-arabinonate dehydratase